MNTILEMAKCARAASLELAVVSSEKKNNFLKILAETLVEDSSSILNANAIDLQKAEEAGISKAMLERLTLNLERIKKISEGVKQVEALPDPVGEIIEKVERPNGIQIEKLRTPIGVIGIIYESRPNVTIDCAVLCIKSGNACILRGGSEAFNTNMALAQSLKKALNKAELNAACVQIIPTSDRSALNEMLKLNEYIHCIIPRGGESLIRFVVENSNIPVIKHYKGVCNVYIDEFANAELAKKLTLNAKCQRPGVCNAAENLIVNASRAEDLLPELAKALANSGVELRTSKKAKQFLTEAGISSKDAKEEDFTSEYVDMIIAIDVVDSLDDAIAFINKNGSAHSDLIVTSNENNAEKFLNGVDSATVYWNASTRFTDGFEFGLGAEIGISTDKLHARGPMGLRELCSYKYKIRGTGQTRD